MLSAVKCTLSGYCVSVCSSNMTVHCRYRLLLPITIFNLKLFSSSCIIARSHIHYNNDNLLL